MAESKPDIAALRQEVKAQRERLIDEKIEKGLAVRGPVIVVGVPDPNRAYRAVTIDDQGREVHPPSDVAVIITGVPRAVRDGDEKRLAAYLASRRTEESDARYEAFRLKPIEAKLLPPLPEPAPEPPPSSPRYYVHCTVRRPDPDKGDPGQIIEASYTITGNLLRVYDEQDRVLGSETLKPGDDVEAAARKVLREKHGKHLSFYDPISYRGNVI